MYTILYCENSKTSDPYGILLNLVDKINLRRSDKYVPLSNRSIYIHKKYKKVILKK